jgi:hypothetical protein
MAENSNNVLFVYTVDEAGDFWIFDGVQYQRFLWNSTGLWFIRSQSFLPKYSYGKCLAFDHQQRQEIENEAARHGIYLPFCGSEGECQNFVLLVPQSQLVFDCTFPGGFFYPA